MSGDACPVAGRYELGDIIGMGSASVVYRGRDRHTGGPVAVKVFRADGSAVDLRQQRREMAALARLRHPGLVALHDGGTEPGPTGRVYVVTELVEGPSLAARLLCGPLDADAVRALGTRLAGALAHVHETGFVHRDIKPANVLLGDGTRPRLADFGIARALDGTVATATGRIVGTAAYLAPEQVRGERIGPPVDVYALGLVLLECLTGRREYPGLAVETLTARLHRRPAVPRGLPWGLTDMLLAMTADDPAHRPTAAAVAAALEAADGGPMGGTTVVMPVPGSRPRWVRHAVAGVAAAVLAAAPVAAAFALTAGSPAATPAVTAGPAGSSGADPAVPAPVAGAGDAAAPDAASSGGSAGLEPAAVVPPVVTVRSVRAVAATAGSSADSDPAGGSSAHRSDAWGDGGQPAAGGGDGRSAERGGDAGRVRAGGNSGRGGDGGSDGGGASEGDGGARKSNGGAGKGGDERG